ncbi:MAG: CehA/McbA family metallohydrolase, partial [Candidatus Aminicenantes bacterium]|nr:CehA/McbA family metallohydrolase [Candidatus Aminicenantes bacterium]
EKGDYLITDGEFLILIGGTSRRLYSNSSSYIADARGSLISIVPAGKKQKSEMAVGAPNLALDGKRIMIDYTSIDPGKMNAEDGSFEFTARAEYREENGLKANIETVYLFAPETGRIDIHSTILNTGNIAFEDLQYSVYFSANHSYNFSPYNRRSSPDLRFNVYPKGDHFLGWMNKNPVTASGAVSPGDLAPGKSYSVYYSLLVNLDAQTLLKNLYEFTDVKPEKATVTFTDYDGSELELTIRDVLSDAVYFRSYLSDTYSYDVLLPGGIYRAQANFFPATNERIFSVKTGEDNTCNIQSPSTAPVRVKITNTEGEHVPGKVTFIGLDPTLSPYFAPDNPLKSGRYWESSKNSCYPPEEGMDVDLPMGTYLVYASRGPEYTIDQKTVEVTLQINRRDIQELAFVINKVVDTKKFISLDAHMHTTYSDGRVKIPERLKSLVAEGVDVAVSTDHNIIIDYNPDLKKLELDKYLAVIIGSEVTKGGVIHYNTYPLIPDKKALFNGAIDSYSEEAAPLFSASRKRDPQAILQVNHPRSGTLGYFNNYQLDIDNASIAKNNFDTSFDILEVMNGPYFYSSNFTAIMDWLHLINKGLYFPIVGNSDSHTIAEGEPGYSRTYIYYNGEKANKLDVNSLLESLKNGHSFLSNGPIVDYTINKTHIPGDSFSSKDGKAAVWIQVQCTPWISISEVRLIINGERKLILPVTANAESIIQFSEEIGLTLSEDSYICVEVLGNQSLFPVLQARSSSGLLENATLPYALTNPIFIDVDGNGLFDAPNQGEIQLKELGKPKVMIQRY